MRTLFAALLVLCGAATAAFADRPLPVKDAIGPPLDAGAMPLFFDLGSDGGLQATPIYGCQSSCTTLNCALDSPDARWYGSGK